MSTLHITYKVISDVPWGDGGGGEGGLITDMARNIEGVCVY